MRRVYEELLKQEKRAVLRMKCLSGATAFFCFAVFLVTFLGLDVVRKIAKGFDFEKGNCVVEQAIFTGSNISCACDMHTCTSHYPCLRVLVKMDAFEPVLLHNTIYDLGSDCTYGPPCKPDSQENYASVLDYKNKKALKWKSVQCYFNPNERTEVILDNRAHDMIAFHAIFWPCFVFLIGVCMLLKTFYMRKTRKKQDFLMPKDIILEKEFHTTNNNVCNYHLLKVLESK